MIWPLPQVSGSRLLQALREVEVGASNIYSHGSDGGSVAESYLKWVSDTVRTFGYWSRPATCAGWSSQRPIGQFCPYPTPRPRLR